MFHLQSLELLHWDYCRRVQLPLDAAIVTIAGPNGSGKTTLLDALRTLLGLECSGGRSYKTYARHSNAHQVWLRATVDNKPQGRQSSSRPFASSLLHGDQVTLACKIERVNGDWQRRYVLADGDRSVEQLLAAPDKDAQWLGVEAWRRRLAAAGLTPAIARVLSLEQGQTDRLCEFSAKELLKLVFDVFGDQDVLDRYEQARGHQQQLGKEVEQAELELGHTRTQLAELALRVNNWKQRQLKVRERERLATEVVPVLDWAESRDGIARNARELHRQRLQGAAERARQAAQRDALLTLHREQQDAAERVRTLAAERDEAQTRFAAARDAERPVEEVVKREQELQAVAASNSDAAALAQRHQRLQDDKRAADERFGDARRERDALQSQLDALQGQRVPPAPSEVQRFRQALRAAGIEHQLLAEVVEVRDERWRAAVEGVLRGLRWVVMLKEPGQEAQAFALAERERYRHYVLTPRPFKLDVPPASLLAVVDFQATVPDWLLRQLAGIRRVDSVDDGRRLDGEWITPQAFWRDGRGGRSVWVDPAEQQFGAAALTGRREHLARRLAQADARLSELATQTQALKRQIDDVQRELQGQRAAEQLAERAAEFAEARERLPALQAARRTAAERWQQLQADHDRALRQDQNAQAACEQARHQLARSEEQVSKNLRDWAERRAQQRAQTERSNEARATLPARWRTPEVLAALKREHVNAQQARLRAQSLDDELAQGTWETDDTVEERHLRMQAMVAEQQAQLDDRRAHNEMARVAVHNARERYIDVLRATVRQYKRNIQELGQLAGVEVNADLPHLENDDAVLAQAGLTVKFNFDGKAAIGLNDGEASGGQQVMKSLILLVGLLKDDETPGGFVFIDEPFAHLDVRNIQLVGHFLRSTRAQYLLTTPITHNVEVFEPAEITLVTSKKPRGERWAPPIAVVQRRGVPQLAPVAALA
jgi:chromosome segregation ATPase